MLKLSKVKGISMLPFYIEGNYVLSINPRLTKLKENDVIIFKHEIYGYLIKRICKKTKKGYYVQGTNFMSTKSCSIGLVTLEMIKGKVIMKI